MSRKWQDRAHFISMSEDDLTDVKQRVSILNLSSAIIGKWLNHEWRTCEVPIAVTNEVIRCQVPFEWEPNYEWDYHWICYQGSVKDQSARSRRKMG